MSDTKGFSLIEVLVFVTIFSLFFITAAAVVTVSLKNMQVNEHKILGTHYANELLEWLRSKKEIDWDHFSSTMTTAAGSNYCFNSALEINASFPTPTMGWTTAVPYPTPPCGSSVGLNPAIYQREVTLVRDPTECGASICKVKVQINVKWQESGNNYNVPINTVFSIWE